MRLSSLVYMLFCISRAQDCMQSSNELLYGCETHRSQYANICCTVPQAYAEHWGFLDTVNLFQQLEANGADAPGAVTIFYDSQCGIPLYMAPMGRSYADWKQESQVHGWPSFRDPEFVPGNMIVHPGYNGEIVSSCNTHLGHNFPDTQSNRHCINLMCIAGVAAVVVNETDLSPTTTAALQLSSVGETGGAQRSFARVLVPVVMYVLHTHMMLRSV